MVNSVFVLNSPLDPGKQLHVNGGTQEPTRSQLRRSVPGLLWTLVPLTGGRRAEGGESRWRQTHSSWRRSNWVCTASWWHQVTFVYLHFTGMCVCDVSPRLRWHIPLQNTADRWFGKHISVSVKQHWSCKKGHKCTENYAIGLHIYTGLTSGQDWLLWYQRLPGGLVVKPSQGTKTSQAEPLCLAWLATSTSITSTIPELSQRKIKCHCTSNSKQLVKVPPPLVDGCGSVCSFQCPSERVSHRIRRDRWNHVYQRKHMAQPRNKEGPFSELLKFNLKCISLVWMCRL